MKVLQAKSRMAIKGNGQCRHCGLSIKSGDWYGATQMPTNPITDRWFTIHVKCMKALVADVPEDVDRAKEAYDSLRARIVASGTLFPNDPELQGV